MFLRWAVAALALHARLHMIRLHPVLMNGVSRMTVEALHRVFQAHAPPSGLFESFRRGAEGAHSYVEPGQFSIETHAALVPVAVPLVDVCLSRGAQPKGPGNRHSDRIFAIGDAVDAAIAFAHQLVRVPGGAENQLRIRPQNIARRHALERTTHPGGRLLERLRSMAGGAVLARRGPGSGGREQQY